MLLLFFAYQGYSLWLQRQPWAYMADVAEGTLYELKDNSVRVGGSWGKIENHIKLQAQNVSRFHLFVSRDLLAFDMRSRNGTTVNAEFLSYGHERELKDGDPITLAGAVVLKLTKANISRLAFLAPSGLERAPIATEAWALLIDGPNRKILPLVANAYYLSSDENGGIIAEERDRGASLLEIQYDGFLTLLDREDEKHLFAVMKEGDYDYNTYTKPIKN
jgi:hypothetical protein